MSEAKHTPGPWRWQRAENGQGSDELTLVGSPDEWKPCESYCFGWSEGSPRSRGPISTPGHEHNHAPTVLCADGWHGSGDLVIDPDSPDARLIAAAPDLLAELIKAHKIIEVFGLWVGAHAIPGDPVLMVDIRLIEREAAIAKAEGRE